MNEYFLPVVAAARETRVVVSTRLLLLLVLNTNVASDPPAGFLLFSTTGLKALFFVNMIFGDNLGYFGSPIKMLP